MSMESVSNCAVTLDNVSYDVLREIVSYLDVGNIISLTKIYGTFSSVIDTRGYLGWKVV
jgi:hypothetical protein